MPNVIWYFLCVKSKIWHKWIYLQNRNRLTDIKIRLWLSRGRRGGRVTDWKFRVSRCKLLYLDWISKILLYSTGNYIDYSMINHKWKRILKKIVHMYGWVTWLHSRDWHSTVNQLYFNKYTYTFSHSNVTTVIDQKVIKLSIVWTHRDVPPNIAYIY